jgi:hypothetical protein
MNKYLKIVHNVIQCVLCNSSRCHYLDPLRKGFIAKMAYLVELWIILESELVERSPHRIFVVLALDQVLREHWSCLTIFGTSTGWSKMKHPGKAEIMGSHLFCGFLGFRVYVTGMGCRPMGLPMFRPFCKCINR